MAILRQKELARLAGVSQATVSRCLRNDLSQNQETRERVLKMAKKLGYIPNSFAAGLAQARSMDNKTFHANLALISGNTEIDPVVTWKAWGSLYESARSQAERHGYSLEYFWRYAPGMTAARLRRMIETRGVKGVILLMINPEELDLPWEALSISSVCVSASWPIRAHYVDFNRYVHILTTLETFAKMGYRRPALAFHAQSEIGMDRGANVGAFHFYQQRLPPEDRLPIYFGPDEGMPSWYKIHRPDIIFSFFSGLVTGLRDRIPSEVGFVNLTGMDHNEMPGCSFLDPRTDLAGTAVLDLVTAQLHRNERGWPLYPNCTLVPSRIHFGNSTGHRRASAKQRRKS